MAVAAAGGTVGVDAGAAVGVDVGPADGPAVAAADAPALAPADADGEADDSSTTADVDAGDAVAAPPPQDATTADTETASAAVIQDPCRRTIRCTSRAILTGSDLTV